MEGLQEHPSALFKLYGMISPEDTFNVHTMSEEVEDLWNARLEAAIEQKEPTWLWTSRCGGIDTIELYIAGNSVGHIYRQVKSGLCDVYTDDSLVCDEVTAEEAVLLLEQRYFPIDVS